MTSARWERYHMGAPPDARSTAAPAMKIQSPDGKLPSKVDFRAQCSPIDDQGTLMSCAACAVVGAMEYLIGKADGRIHEYSRLFVYYNGRKIAGETNQDSGLATPHAIAAALAYGIAPEPTWPYDIQRFREEPPQTVYQAAQSVGGVAYAQTPRGEPARAALASGFPVIFRYYGPVDLIRAVRGDGRMAPWQGAPAPQGMGHTMMMVGYDDDQRCAIVRNSWGADFGDKGYFYMPYDVMENATQAMEYWMMGVIGEKLLPMAVGVGGSVRQAVEHTIANGKEQAMDSLKQLGADLRKDLQDSLDSSKQSIRDRLRAQEDQMAQKRNRDGGGNQNN
ncbi:MAG TPA: C1 family peptidase [Hyphomonadaceae bacterium]|nr:C1 family peptidase [Hyphomonadaceae bacterium]